MELSLRPSEVRVLGSLMEKEMSTPEYCPMSLNALRHACNQKNNRDPVSDFDEETISDALMTLARKDLVETVLTDGSRVDKYRHCFDERFRVSDHQLAVICELFLRGPQTLGELHSRTRRLVDTDSIEAVRSAVEELLSFPSGPMVRKLERRPGQKDRRYMHLFCPEQLKAAEHGDHLRAGSAEEGAASQGHHTVLLKHSDDPRVALLVDEVAALKRDMAILSERVEGLSRQLSQRQR